MVGHNKKERDTPKIRLGRLAVDPVFLLIFAFFVTSSMLMLAFMFLSSR